MKYEKGQTWWFIIDRKIVKKEYLCEYPFKNINNLGSYHIILNKIINEPERIYCEHLDKLVEKHSHIKSYEDACVELIKSETEHLKSTIEIYGLKS
jgi:hypothetical protein